jgi:LCP family protein required for cell wall assembly
VVVVVLLGAGAAVGIYRKLEGNIASLDIFGALRDRPEAIEVAGPAQPVNILLIGSDTRETPEDLAAGGGEAVQGARSDTTILLHLSADRSRAVAVSIPRDSWVPIPSCTAADGTTSAPVTAKFNAAYETGGPACTIQTVESLTNVRIDHFVVVDFAGFRNMVNALGGVDVCVPEEMTDSESGLDLPAGRSTIDGDQALAFVRARKGIGDGSDLGRIDRQQAFLASMVQKATSTGILLNPVRLVGFLDAATKSVTTDPGLSSVSALGSLATSLKDVSTSGISFVTVPVADRGDGANLVWLEDQAAPLFDALRNDTPLPGQTPAPPTGTDQPLTVDPSDVQVRVLNGSGQPGAAAQAAQDLDAAGFVVVETGNADRTHYDHVVVRVGEEATEAGRTLAASLPGAGVETDPAGGEVVTVVVGADYTGVQQRVVPTQTASSSAIEGRTADEDVCAA